MMRHTEMTAKAIRLLMGALVAATMVGCTPKDDPNEVFEGGVDMMRNRTLQRRQALAGRQFVQVRTIVVDIPTGPGPDGEIWGLVDESSISDLQRRALTDNGMRVGVGSQEEWPALADALEELAGRKTEEVTSIVEPQDLFSIAVKTRQPERTAFLIHPDGTLSGLDLPAGEYLLTLLSVPSTDDDGAMTLSCQPKVRSSRRYAQVTNGEGGPVIDSQHRLISVNLMTCQTMIEPGQFLLIGPSQQARRESSVGHHLFLKTKAGLTIRTYFVLMPDLIEQ